MVGVNTNIEDDEADLEILRISHELEGKQVAKVADVRASRDQAVHAAAMERLEAAASTDENLVPIIMDAVRAEATVGEISKALQNVWGTYREVPRI
jgi:methylmalonyl-CoA mutase N-terminal domain/subunit